MMNYNSIPTNSEVPGMAGQITPIPQPSIMPGQQTPISPKALSNQGTINAMFGQAVPGTYTRNVMGSPLMQSAADGRMTSQGYMPGVDPTDMSNQPTLNALQASTGMPIPPPAGVQQPIAPFYDLSNQ